MHLDTVFLDQVNKNLKEMVAIAETDFVEVNTVLRRMYGFNPDEQNKNRNADVQLKLETIMAGLQYMDVLSQRIDHLVLTHQQMITPTGLKKWFFHLHIFQFMTIELDLLRSIELIERSLEELKSESSGQQKNKPPFVNTRRVKEVIGKTIEALSHAGGDIRHLPIPPLTEDQIRALSSLYTMDKERTVLMWFQNSMPVGTWNDLLLHYESKNSVTEAENIELF